MRTAVYPGSFDPVTNVHLDIIERAVYMFDYLVASVVVNPSKDCRFGVEERVGMLREVPADLGNVRVDFFHGLTLDYCRREKFTVRECRRWLRSKMPTSFNLSAFVFGARAGI